MKISPRSRLPILLACSMLLSTTPGRAADSIEGIWQGQSGPSDNQATLALEIVRSSKGELDARMYIDQIGVYGQAVGMVQRRSRRIYAVPAADMTLTLAKRELQVTGFLRDPKATVTMVRVFSAPAAPPRPKHPAGSEPQWRIRLGGAIFAPVAAADGIAYVGNTDGVMSAVSISDGKRLWSFAAGRPVFGEALVSAGALYFVCDNGYLFRLDRTTGKETWRYDLGDARTTRVLPDPYVYDYDYRSPRPVLSGDTLFVGSGDGTFHAVNASTGARVWHIDGNAAIRSSAVVAGSLLVFSDVAGRVQAVDQSTGRKQWTFDAKVPATEPALVAGKIIVGARDSMLAGLANFIYGQKYLLGHAEPRDPAALRQRVFGPLTREHLIYLGSLGLLVVIWGLIQAHSLFLAIIPGWFEPSPVILAMHVITACLLTGILWFMPSMHVRAIRTCASKRNTCSCATAISTRRAA